MGCRYVKTLVLQSKSHLRKVSGGVSFIDQGKGTFSELALFLTWTSGKDSQNVRAALLCSKKIPVTRRRDKKDAEGKGRTRRAEAGEAEGQSQGV